MLNKFFKLIFCYLILTTPLHSNSTVYIKATVNGDIITNYDIKKEIAYLKILNPNLNQLKKEKIFDIAKNSLINEIIKTKEIEKIFNLKKEIAIIDELFTNLYKGLNFKSEAEFLKILLNQNSYTTNEIKNKLKIEVFWNELIVKKYNSLVKIDENKLLQTINKKKSGIKNEYLLSEIFFKKLKNKDINEQIEEIYKSINQVGFNNTANIFSISESANYGGKIGWVEEDKLSKKILSELKKISDKDHTKVIQIGNNFLILKIEKIKTKKIKIDKKKLFSEMKIYERNRQLNRFSNIYFSKVKINYIIDEK